LANSTNGALKTCLLVDDDEDDREIFCLALAEADPTVKCIQAKDGREALNLLNDKSFVPDYIFLDLNMPLMNGKECLAEMRKRRDLDGIRVIIFSTSSSDRDIQETKQLGASGFIKKPPLTSTLAKNLSELFNNRQSMPST
jgi:CheY-like chemotaxis protein